MASVYFHTLRKQTQLRGGGGLLLPSVIELSPLEEALDFLKGRDAFEARLREAVWTVLRAAPPPRSPKDVEAFETRYPPELFAIEDRERIRDFDEQRRVFRSDAHLFAAALVALANVNEEQFRSVSRLYEESDGGASAFATATRERGVLGDDVTPEVFLNILVGDDFDNAAEHLAALEHEVGLSLYTFVEEFADAVAYLNWSDVRFDRDGVYVFPAATSVVQDAATLTTTVTVTALVRAPEFGHVRKAIDPRNWGTSSDVFERATYVKSAGDLTELTFEEEPIGVGFEGPSRPFLEKVNVSWGADPAQVGEFVNVLNIEKFDTGETSVDLEFSLDRCLRSRFLWDERAGGIVIDEGYTRARQIAPDVCRVTTRKILQFSDRTPYSGATGWFDFGQLLNYLAPATLTWWLESEVYSTTGEQEKAARPRRALYEQGRD